TQLVHTFAFRSAAAPTTNESPRTAEAPRWTLGAASSLARRARPKTSPGRSPGFRLGASLWQALRSPEPSRAVRPVASLGFAPRSQWRDRAGLSPASLFGPDGGCRLRPATPGRAIRLWTVSYGHRRSLARLEQQIGR